jgi:hypothetical protein
VTDRLGVLSSTAYVVEHAQRVHIDQERIESLAAAVAASGVAVPSWNRDLHWAGIDEQTAMYTFVLDSLNFCFWGEPRWKVTYNGLLLDGYWALAASLRRAVEEGRPILDAAYLATIGEADLASILRGSAPIPLFAERLANLQELGRVLVERYHGQCAEIIRAAGGDAVALVRRVASDLSSFNDVATYQERDVLIYKRAQILVGDLAGSLEGKGLGAFRNLHELTAFADYKLPQILRRFGVLAYDPALAARVDARDLITAGSGEEVEIRAATLWVVELLRRALAEQGRDYAAYQLDWWLWETSQHLPPDAWPYHRTRTIFY